MDNCKKQCRTTKRCIDGTVYIVESMVSENATETTYSKIKRLILNNAQPSQLLSETSQSSPIIRSTSAR